MQNVGDTMHMWYTFLCRHLLVAMAMWHTTHLTIVLQRTPISVLRLLVIWTVFISLHPAAPLHQLLYLLPSTHLFHQVSYPVQASSRTKVRFFCCCDNANIKF